MSDATSEIVQRSLRLDLHLPEEFKAQYQRILSSIRQYRAALRHCFGTLVMAQDAGAVIEWVDDNVRVTPDTDRARLICGLATGQAQATRQTDGERQRGAGDSYNVQIGRGPAYELRAEFARLAPTMLSFVGDSGRRDIHTAWRALDPEHNRTTRGWLTLQGARQPARFQNRGIGFPMATAKPRFAGYRLVLKWDHDLGEIEFKTGTLDPHRRHVWRNVADGVWKPGTVYLSERDGKLFTVITYSRPAVTTDVDPQAVLTVRFPDDSNHILMYYRGDYEELDGVGAAAVRAFLLQAQRRREYLELRRGDMGAPRRPWGFRKGWSANQEVLDRATLTRERTVRDYNHVFTRRIVSRALQWRCGTIMLYPTPTRSFNDGPLIGSIGEWPWNWTEFRSMLDYKAAEVGVTVVDQEGG